MEEIIRLSAGSAAAEKDRDTAGNTIGGNGREVIGAKSRSEAESRIPAENRSEAESRPSAETRSGIESGTYAETRQEAESRIPAANRSEAESWILAENRSEAESTEGGREGNGKAANAARGPEKGNDSAVTAVNGDVPADGGSPEEAVSPETAEEDTSGRRARARQKREARRNAIIEEVISWVKSFVLMFAVALFLTQFIIINAVIPSGSMEETIMTHDRLIGARFSYWFSEPARGDIVIFHYPVDEKKIYIKRIIGLPGETVRIEGGKIYIDDAQEPLEEGYLKEEWEVLNSGFEFHVPEGCYLMLGDNRNWSEDARYWAENAVFADLAETIEEAEPYTYVRKEKILGKAVFTYFRKFRILKHGEWYE